MTGSEQPTFGQGGPGDTTGGEPEAVRIWLLGGFRVSVGSSRGIGKDEWHLRKAAHLVKLLALVPNHRLHREQMMELPWPDADRRATSNNLRKTLHSARRTLDPEPAAGASGVAVDGDVPLGRTNGRAP